MSITKEILSIVSNYPGGYKIIYNILYQNNKNISTGKSQSLRNTLSRMKSRGLLSNSNQKWEITKEGRALLKEKKSTVIRFSKRKKVTRKQIKTTIVIFDIPEKKRVYRDWLRSELIGFGFELVQKSVWFGPSLPKEFINYLNQEKIIQYVRFFKATELDLI